VFRELAAELEAGGMELLVGGLELLEVMITRRNDIDAMIRRVRRSKKRERQSKQSPLAVLMVVIGG
jgi:hypothetical protein